MGVRFECPNGHKLNVKAELAGKRGICPECGVRFIVPAFSGERVPAVDVPMPSAPAGANLPRAVEGAAHGVEPVAVPFTAPSAAASQPGPAAATSSSTRIAVEPPLPQPLTTVDSAPVVEGPIAWYVRPVTGGQYGPASTEVFWQWIAEGRVLADSWVWRTGWPEWKPGVESLPLVAQVQSAPPVAGIPPVGMSDAVNRTTAPIAATPVVAAQQAHHESSLAEARRTELKRRKRRVQSISILLGVLALVMAAVLMIVLSR